MSAGGKILQVLGRLRNRGRHIPIHRFHHLAQPSVRIILLIPLVLMILLALRWPLAILLRRLLQRQRHKVIDIVCLLQRRQRPCTLHLEDELAGYTAFSIGYWRGGDDLHRSRHAALRSGDDDGDAPPLAGDFVAGVAVGPVSHQHSLFPLSPSLYLLHCPPFLPANPYLSFKHYGTNLPRIIINSLFSINLHVLFTSTPTVKITYRPNNPLSFWVQLDALFRMGFVIYAGRGIVRWIFGVMG